MCVQFTQKEEEVNKILAALQKQMEDYQVALDQRRLLLSSLHVSIVLANFDRIVFIASA